MLFGETWEAAQERSFWKDLKATAEQEKQTQEHPLGQGQVMFVLKIHNRKSFWFANSPSSPWQMPERACQPQVDKSCHTLCWAFKKMTRLEMSLVGQWLRLCSSTAGDMSSIPSQGTKILHAMWLGQKHTDKNQKVSPVLQKVTAAQCWAGS